MIFGACGRLLNRSLDEGNFPVGRTQVKIFGGASGVRTWAVVWWPKRGPLLGVFPPWGLGWGHWGGELPQGGSLFSPGCRAGTLGFFPGAGGDNHRGIKKGGPRGTNHKVGERTLQEETRVGVAPK